MGVSVEVVESAALVTLRWPERRNALGPDDSWEVTDALVEAGKAARAAIVLAGEGAFCAGGDLSTFAEISRTCTPEQIEREVYGTVQAMVRALRKAPVPTIAAVDGPAVGLGMDLALACDMRFVGSQGFLQQGWARAGLIAGTGGIGLLHRVAPGLLWRLVAEQPRLDAASCAALGLGEDAGQRSALEAALSRVEALARVPRDVLGHYAALERAASWPVDDTFRESARVQSGLIGSERFRETAQRVLGR